MDCGQTFFNKASAICDSLIYQRILVSVTNKIVKRLIGRKPQLLVSHVRTRGKPVTLLPVALSVMRNDTFCTTTIVRKKRGNVTSNSGDVISGQGVMRNGTTVLLL
jgi:hypothetical protein